MLDRSQHDCPAEGDPPAAAAVVARVLEGLAQGVAVWDAGGTCLFSNPSAHLLLEVEAGRLAPGAAARDLLERLASRGDLSADDLRALLQAHAGGAPLTRERRLGSGRILTCAVRPQRGGGSVLYLDDVTAERTASAERDAARAGQREMAERLNAIIARMDQGVVVWDAGGRCAFHNERIVELLGLGPGELEIGMTRERFRDARRANGEFGDAAQAAAEGAIAAREPFDFDTVTPDGRVLVTRSRPAEDGGWVTTLTDVTDSRRLAAAHREVATRLDEVLASMEQGVIVWDAHGRCAMRNPRFDMLLELEEGMLCVGTERGAFLRRLGRRGDHRADQTERVLRGFASGRAFRFDRSLPSGRVVTSHARPLEDGGFIVTLTDVTEERRASEELKVLGEEAARAREEAQEALARELRRREETRLSGQVDEWLQTCRSEAELCRVLERALVHAFPETRGAAYLWAEPDRFERTLCWGGAGPDMDAIEADDCWALRRGRRYRFERGAIGLPCRHIPEAERHLNAICLPIVSRGRTLGAVHLRLPGRAATDEELEDGTALATRIVEHFGLALSNLRVRDGGNAELAGDSAARAAI